MLVYALDDEPLLLDALKSAIEEAEPKADIHTFSRANLALKEIEDSSLCPDVAFLDVEMPGMSGLELARHIKDIPGTEINDPIVQAADNDYYLKRDEYGNPATWGCYYADYLCNLSGRSALSTNTVIYGHSHKTEDPNERKFTQLFRYCDIDFLREYPYMYLSIDGEDLIFQVAAVFFTDISFDYINPEPSGEELPGFFDTITRKNEYIFDGLDFGPEDRILTLSTCSYRYDSQNTGTQRFVVMGKLLPEGAAASPRIVTENPNPERP